MQIYTAHTNGERAERVKQLGLGFLLHSCPDKMPSKECSAVPCALDNGAFTCWLRGYPFQADIFMRAIEKAYAARINLDFIVCPDIVTGGIRSLDFSMRWATKQLETAQRLALAVQDGMTPRDISVGFHLPRFTHIFVGGSVEWKWHTAKEWVDFSHAYGKKCHIGRCGTLQNLQAAKRYGADSVDSSSFARNESWDVIEEFANPKQRDLLDEANTGGQTRGWCRVV